MRYFAVVSNKATLEDYRDMIENDPQKFYNKCVQYLLEKICQYLIEAGASEGEIRVIFEKRNHDYARMTRFLGIVKGNPKRPQSRALRVLDLTKITELKKGEDRLLDIADFVSHAVYKCVDKTHGNHLIPEPRYLQEIASRFAPNQEGYILDVGLKCIHRIGQLELDGDIEEALKAMKGIPPPCKERAK